MTSTNVQGRRSMLTALVAELERHGAGRPAEIAHRLGAGWTENKVVEALAELFSVAVVGHNHDVGLWQVA